MIHGSGRCTEVGYMSAANTAVRPDDSIITT